MTTIHCCLSVRGYLASDEKLRSLVGSLTKNGEPLTRVDEVREALFDQLARGHEVLPLGKPCEGFDYKKGCPGHEKETE